MFGSLALGNGVTAAPGCWYSCTAVGPFCGLLVGPAISGCVSAYQPNFGRVCCDLESQIQHLYAKIYALYYNCVQTSRTMHLYPAYKLINLRIFNTTGLFFLLKRSKKDPFLVHNSCGAWPAASASDDQQMQLWTIAPRGLTRLARPLCITLV